MKRLLSAPWLLLILWLTAATLHAGQVESELEPVPNRHPTERALLVGWGRASQLDTYLSPMTYSGWQISFMTQRERMTHLADHHISFQSTLQGAFTDTDNPAGTASYLGGRLAYDAGWHYHYQVLPGFDLKGGALLGADVGFLYNDRNGNNPAQGRFSADVSLSAGLGYSFNVKKLHMRAAYQADLPMMGLMFVPEFGESYYEISEAGASHDILFAHPGNALSLRQLLTLDVCLKRVTLRVGYLCDVRQSNAHSLKYRDTSHSFMFGIVRHFQLLRIKD